VKNILIYSNCQGEGLHKFLLLNPEYRREFNVKLVMAYMIDLGLTLPDELFCAAPSADIFIYHWLDPGNHKLPVTLVFEKLKPSCLRIPLSVVFNHGPFIFHYGWTDAEKAEMKSRIATMGITGATSYYMTEADMRWQERWDQCMEKMIRKEESDGVDPVLRMSGFVQDNYKKERLLLTFNHPSTALFWPWAVKLAEYLCVPLWNSKPTDPNFAELPCSEPICESAKKHLGLEFNADDRGPVYNGMYTALSTLL
jgi:hypothetical protein